MGEKEVELYRPVLQRRCGLQRRRAMRGRGLLLFRVSPPFGNGGTGPGEVLEGLREELFLPMPVEVPRCALMVLAPWRTMFAMTFLSS